jgi:hypothetical protein
MLSISRCQVSQLSDSSREDFFLRTVCEWQALFEACHGRVSRIGFDQAWQIVEYLMEQVDDLPRPWEDGTLYSLAHTVLSAAENGATSEQLHEGVAAYCRALPADEAGLIVLETICEAPSPIDGA